MPRNNRFATNSLNDLNRRREEQENGGRVDLNSRNRESRRANGEVNESHRVLSVDIASNNVLHNPNVISYASSLGSIERIEPCITFNSSYESVYFSSSSNTPKYKYIKSYNYKPDEFIFSCLDIESEDNKLFLGTEIEIDCAGEDDDKAKYVNDSLKNCYTVHDGSLNNGFEIVTHPATLNYHKQMNYKEVFEWLLDKGYRSHDTRTCGLHIHVNRNYLSNNKTIQDLCITKILFLLEKYWDEVTKIARRSECNYSVKIKRDKDDDSLFDLLYKAKGSNGYFSNSKYNCLNLLHKDTIEFRIFKGTLKYETYIATLEFVKNIVDICKKVSLEDIQSITFEDIINVNETEYLLQYLEERKIN